MKRLIGACFMLLIWTSCSRSQDMALSQILVEGQDWQLVEKEKESIGHLLGQAKAPAKVWLPRGRSYPPLPGKPGLILNHKLAKKTLKVGLTGTALTP